MRSGEDNGAVFVNQDTVLEVPPEGTGKDNFFQIFAFANEITDGVAVGHANDILSYDRAIIEIRGDVVTGGTDDFHSALMGRMVGARAGKGGQE